MPTLNAMFRLYDGYTRTINNVINGTDRAAGKILKASSATDTFNGALSKTGSGASLAASGLGKFAAAIVSLAVVKKGMDVSDSYINTTARLNLMNDGLQTTAELQDKIFAAADRSRGAYTDMAGSIAKMGILAGEAFSSNDELIGFSELVQKSFKIGGANQGEQSAGLHQLTQAMASGRLQGDEFRSITENAPMIAIAIAKATGKSKGDLKQMSADGVITADIIKNAMFSMSKEINEDFEKIPKGFGDYWNQIKNGALQAFSPIIEKVNEIINTDAFQTSVDVMVTGMNLVAIGIGGIIDGFVWLNDTISDNWNTIWPFLVGIGVVMLPMIIGGLVTMATALWGMVTPLLTMAAAWILMNLPIVMVILAIAGIIIALQRMGVTFQDIFGFVGGVIGVFVGFFYNYFVYLYNIVATFINFFGNVFSNPVASIKALFYDLMVNVLGFIETMAKGIENLLNKIPGVNINISSGITNLKDKLQAKSSSIKDEAGLKEFVKSKEFMDYSTSYDMGSAVGDKVYGAMATGLSGLGDMFTGNKVGGDDLSGFSGAGGPLEVSGKNGKAVEVDVSKQDLKYLKDIAEREYINKFSTATLAPNIQVSFGDIKETADADQVAKRIQKILREEIATVAEG